MRERAIPKCFYFNSTTMGDTCPQKGNGELGIVFSTPYSLVNPEVEQNPSRILRFYG